MTGLTITLGVIIGILAAAAVVIAAIGLRALFRDDGAHTAAPAPVARRKSPPRPRRTVYYTPYDYMPAPLDVSGPKVGTADRAHGDPVTAPETPASAAVHPPAQPPPVHHDEYAPPQTWHPEPEPQPDAAHQAAVAVGAAIAATHARIAERERARKAELEAEAERTRPWADDTGTFTLKALGLKEVA